MYPPTNYCWVQSQRGPLGLNNRNPKYYEKILWHQCCSYQQLHNKSPQTLWHKEQFFIMLTDSVGQEHTKGMGSGGGGGTESGVSLEDPKAGVTWRRGAGIIWSPAHTFAGGWYWLLAWALAGESVRTPTCGLSMWSLHFFALWSLGCTYKHPKSCITFNGPSLEVIKHHLLHSHKSPHMGGGTQIYPLVGRSVNVTVEECVGWKLLSWPSWKI